MRHLRLSYQPGFSLLELKIRYLSSDPASREGAGELQSAKGLSPFQEDPGISAFAVMPLRLPAPGEWRGAFSEEEREQALEGS